MERLRELLADLGCQNVQTYLQSGNAVFGGSGTAAKWAAAIESRLVGETRLGVTVIVRSAAELAKVSVGNPFLSAAGVDPTKLDTTKLLVTFLAAPPTPAAIAKLLAVPAGVDRVAVMGKHAYLYCPNGYGQTKLSGSLLERTLAVRCTTRNWNTITNLLKMTVP